MKFKRVYSFFVPVNQEILKRRERKKISPPFPSSLEPHNLTTALSIRPDLSCHDSWGQVGFLSLLSDIKASSFGFVRHFVLFNLKQSDLVSR